MFWYDFELFLNNWYLDSLISFMLVRGSNWNSLLLKKMPSHKLKCTSGISHQSMHVSGKETKMGVSINQMMKPPRKEAVGAASAVAELMIAVVTEFGEKTKEIFVSYSSTSPRALNASAGAGLVSAVADPCNEQNDFSFPLFCGLKQ